MAETITSYHPIHRGAENPIPPKVTSAETRECGSCKHSKDGHMAGTEECHECMWENKLKTGRWVAISDGYSDGAYICECSECKETVWVYKDAERRWNYCPNCGARMESEE